MKLDIDNLIVAMKRIDFTPDKIRFNGKYHEFITGIDAMGQPVIAYYICKDGVALYGCISRNISKKWSNKKDELMTDSELRHYKKVLRELREVRDIAMASDSTRIKTANLANIDEPIIKNSGRPVQITEPAPAVRKMALKASKWDDHEILRDRVAQRFLRNCTEVIGDRSKIKTLRLIELLNSDENMPWYVYNKGNPIGNQHLWRILEKFDIRSTDIRFKSGVAKGFHTETFLQAWRCVLWLLVFGAKVNK